MFMTPEKQAAASPQQDLVGFFRSFKEMLDGMRSDFRETLATIPEEQRDLLRRFTSDYSVSQLISDFKKAEYEKEKTICGILQKREWWVRLDAYLTWDELQRIKNLDSAENGGRLVDEFICGKFREREFEMLEGAVARWWCVRYLKERQNIILDALSAHKNGIYTLSIPAVLPLLDGLAFEIIEHGSSRKHTTEAAERYYQHEAANLNRLAEDYEDALWSDLFCTAVREYVYAGYDFRAERPPSVINRHGILHGRLKDYSTEANSLRVFLLLDGYFECACVLKVRSLPQ